MIGGRITIQTKNWLASGSVSIIYLGRVYANSTYNFCPSSIEKSLWMFTVLNHSEPLDLLNLSWWVLIYYSNVGLFPEAEEVKENELKNLDYSKPPGINDTEYNHILESLGKSRLPHSHQTVSQKSSFKPDRVWFLWKNRSNVCVLTRWSSRLTHHRNIMSLKNRFGIVVSTVVSLRLLKMNLIDWE